MRPLTLMTFATLTFATSPLLASEGFTLDPTHSFVSFSIQHLGVGTAQGRFNKLTGSVNWDDDKPESGSIEVDIDTASVDTNDKKRDEHLRGPDFFNARQFPKMTFRSTAVTKNGESLDVTGDLTIRGVTKSITVKVKKIGKGKDPWGNTRIGFDTTFIVLRSEFGVSYMPEGLGEEVEVHLSVEATHK